MLLNFLRIHLLNLRIFVCWYISQKLQCPSVEVRSQKRVVGVRRSLTRFSATRPNREDTRIIVSHTLLIAVLNFTFSPINGITTILVLESYQLQTVIHIVIKLYRPHKMARYGALAQLRAIFCSQLGNYLFYHTTTSLPPPSSDSCSSLPSDA
jgi:hypothetical protein